MSGIDQVCKILIIGDDKVGKSALVDRFVDESFGEKKHGANISAGVEMGVRSLELFPVLDGRRQKRVVKLQIYHPPGAEQYRDYTTRYFKEVDCIVLLFDTSNLTSVSNLTSWLDEISILPNRKELVIFLVGTKIDKITSEQHREVDGKLQDILSKYHYPCMEVSSKTGENVEELFEKLANIMLMNKEEPELLHLDNLFNHDKGLKKKPEDPEQRGIGSKISSYFKGKFKRQRRRLKQKILQTVSATDATVDSLYLDEKKRYTEFDSRLKQMNKRLDTIFNALHTAFDEGVKLGDDFHWFTSSQINTPSASNNTSELVGAFTAMMAEASRKTTELKDALNQSVKAECEPRRQLTESEPTDVQAHIPGVKLKMEQRDRALLDFDAYRRKLRNTMANKSGLDGMTNKLKKQQAKLLRSQETFEVLNTQLVEDFISSSHRRAGFMTGQFKTTLKMFFKLFHSVAQSMDNIAPLINQSSQKENSFFKKEAQFNVMVGGSSGDESSSFDMSMLPSMRGGSQGSLNSLRQSSANSSMQFSSDQVEQLFNPDQEAETKRLQHALMESRKRNFYFTHGFQKLHEMSQPPEIDLDEYQWDASLITRARRASKHVRPPPPPKKPPTGLAKKRRNQSQELEVVAEEPETLTTPAPAPESSQPPHQSAAPDSNANAAPEDEEAAGQSNEYTVKHVRAVYEYEPQYEGDLQLCVGDVILVYQWTEGDDRSIGWWQGYCKGKMGYFPSTYVEMMSSFDNPDEPAPEMTRLDYIDDGEYDPDPDANDEVSLDDVPPPAVPPPMPT